MMFIAPRLQDSDGQPGPKVLAFELVSRDGGTPRATILVEREDYHGKEWVIWSTRYHEYEQWSCYDGTYLHSNDGWTAERARERYDERVQHFRA